MFGKVLHNVLEDSHLINMNLQKNFQPSEVDGFTRGENNIQLKEHEFENQMLSPH